MQSHKLDTKERITESLKELVVEKGFEKIKIKDITDRIQMTRPTFYSYFQDKYEVIEYIFKQEVLLPTIPFLEGGFLREGFLTLLMQMEKEKSFYREVSKITGQNSFQEILEHVSLDVLKDILKKHMGNKKLGILGYETVAEFYEKIFQFILIRWLNAEEDISPSEMMQVYDIVVSKSLNDIMTGKI